MLRLAQLKNPHPASNHILPPDGRRNFLPDDFPKLARSAFSAFESVFICPALRDPWLNFFSASLREVFCQVAAKSACKNS
jgi:hypothetical protein